jgi:hypothetical protein
MEGISSEWLLSKMENKNKTCCKENVIESILASDAR